VRTRHLDQDSNPGLCAKRRHAFIYSTRASGSISVRKITSRRAPKRKRVPRGFRLSHPSPRPRSAVAAGYWNFNRNDSLP
jgi:hypothetical protein